MPAELQARLLQYNISHDYHTLYLSILAPEYQVNEKNYFYKSKLVGINIKQRKIFDCSFFTSCKKKRSEEDRRGGGTIIILSSTILQFRETIKG